MDGLQKFIEINMGKLVGGKPQKEGVEYRIGDMLVFTFSVEWELVTVSWALFGWVFSIKIDRKKIESHVDFYNWLEDVFIPKASESFISACKEKKLN